MCLGDDSVKSIERKQAMAQHFEEKLNALDLGPILFLLVRAEDGPKWTLPQSIIAEK
jgi:hypothetical protein